MPKKVKLYQTTFLCPIIFFFVLRESGDYN